MISTTETTTTYTPSLEKSENWSSGKSDWLYCNYCNILCSKSLKCDLCQLKIYCSIECQKRNYLSHLEECKQEIHQPEKDVISWFMKFEQLDYVLQSLLCTLKNTNFTLCCAITSMGICPYNCVISDIPCNCEGYLCQVKNIDKKDAKELLLNFGIFINEIESNGAVIYSYTIKERIAAIAVKYIEASDGPYIFGSLKKLNTSTLIYPINIHINKENGSKNAKLSISKVGQI